MAHIRVADWLKTLGDRGIELWFEGERLRYRARPGSLTADERAELSARRSDVIEHLRSQATAQEAMYPLSYSQQSLWFLHLRAPESSAYHVGMAARVAGEVDLGAFRHAMQALVDRHAILRTTYGVVEGVSRQRVAGAREVDLQIHERPDVSDAQLRAEVQADLGRPFDLERGPVFRVSLYSRTSTEHVFLVAAHHIAVDGWSLMVLFDELRRLYTEARGGPPASLPRPSVQYTDYAAWQAEMLAGQEGEQMWNYWRQKLAEPRSQLELPTDRPRPPRQSFRGASLPLAVDADTTQTLKELARSENTTLFVVLLASFQAFLYRLTGTEDVIVGSPTFARSKEKFMRVVGDFVNSVPLRARLAPQMPFRELIAELRGTLHEALTAQEFPLPLLVQRLAPERDASRPPLFDAFFILQRFENFRDLEVLASDDETADPVALGDLSLTPFPVVQQEGQFDLALRMIELKGVLRGVLAYSSDVFEEATVKRLTGDYLALVEAVVTDPGIPLGMLPEPARPSKALPSVRGLLERLEAADIRAFLDGDKLRVNAPKGALTAEIKQEISAHRDELIAALKERPEAPTDVVSQLGPIVRNSPLPASSSQQRIWFLDQLDPGQAQYNIGGALRVYGALNVEFLQRALDDLVRRHECLRTSIGERGGTPDVGVMEPGPAVLDLVDLSHLPRSEADVEAHRNIVERLRAPFELSRGPLATYTLIRLAPDEHLFNLCMHHVIADGWSMFIVFRELWRFYQDAAEGHGPSAVPLSIQYVDYAAYEQRRLHSGQLGRHLAYWKRQLEGAPALLELPTDRPRPAAQSFRGHRLHLYLDTALIETLKQTSRQHQTTLFMTLLAAFQVLLYRHSGQDDIVVGTPVANRELPELEGIVGCFVNNLVLRSKVEPTSSFAEFLASVKQMTLAAFDHGEVPFDVLVDALRPQRTANHAPLFQVLFALQSFVADFPAPHGLRIEETESPDTGIARFDLALELAEYGGKFHAVYEYASDLFDEGTILRLHGHFQRLLRAIADSHDQPLESLPMLPAEEERLLIDEWNQTRHEHESYLHHESCLHHLVTASVEQAPDAVAVVAQGERLSYRSFEERANRLARLLMARGVRPGSLVAVCVDRTVDMPVALAAVLKAGAAYVPLDPTHPEERLRYTLEDAQVACAITLSTYREMLAGAGAPLVCLDQVADELARLSEQPPDVPVSPGDRAYVIYTSGSTGRPKGVEVEHRNIVAFIRAMQSRPGFAAQDRLLAVTTLSFDIAGLELWLPLSVGAPVTIAARHEVLDSQRLMQLLDVERINVLQATPATFRLLLEAGWPGKPDLKVLCGGEALPRDLATALAHRVGELWNMYGPTETTVWSTCSRIRDAAGAITIGRPIENTRVYVVEASGQIAPIGVQGELCIGGEGVARGYLNRPELTAEKFVELGLPGGRKERVYRTGDVVRYRADGRLEYIGRRDFQVKVRGYRIELGEIEAVLADQGDVQQCVVLAREDNPGDQRLVAYVVPCESMSFDVEAARKMLRSKLPEYMMPNLFVTLEALPLTPNGKVDRKALPAPRESVPETPAAQDVLMTPTQQRVAKAWREVLKRERIGLYDNFFNLGGHSLLLVKLHATLKREFESELNLVELFQWTTVAAQAARLSSNASADDALRRAQARAARQTNG